jgi:sterol desaturase/sphingolipid hydroxylase (fatty acid hydroxylase superfamily)
MEADALLRGAIALGVLGAVVLWETLAPARPRALNRWVRWPSIAGLALVNQGVARLLAPAGLAAVALWGQGQGIGLLHLMQAPLWLAVPVAILVLDLAVWAQHRASHAVPLLWRLHRVHHADPDVDALTALRFHPVEIALSLAWKAAVVLALGAPALAVLAFEAMLNASALFNHANARLPAPVERIARLFIITPDLHRVHHSPDRVETDSNFGFLLSVWDRLFGAFRPVRADPDGPQGLEIFRTPSDQRLDALLLQPLQAAMVPPRNG